MKNMEKVGVIFSIAIIVFTIFSLPQGFFKTQNTTTVQETTTSSTQQGNPATTFVTIKPTTIIPSPTITTMFTGKTVTTIPTTSSKTVLFSDDFSKWQSVWNKEYDGNAGKVFYSNGKLHILDRPPKGWVVQKLNSDFSNFILDVDVTHVDGSINNWISIDVRTTTNVDGNIDGYCLAISSDGKYNINKWESEQQTILVPVQNSSYIHRGIGSTNHLTIECNNNILILTVNGHQLGTATDSTFSRGKIYLSIYTPIGYYTEVAFDNLTITSI